MVRWPASAALVLVLVLFANERATAAIAGAETKAGNAAGVAKAFEDAAQGSARCVVRQGVKAVVCAVRTSDSEADKLVRGIVSLAKRTEVDLRGWKVTLVTHNDYVVTRRF